MTRSPVRVALRWSCPLVLLSAMGVLSGCGSSTPPVAQNQPPETNGVPSQPRVEPEQPKHPIGIPPVVDQHRLPPVEPAGPAAEYGRLMRQGREARIAKQHAEAVRAFEKALEIMPGDATAAAELKQAHAALANSIDRSLADYQKHMKEGNAALQQKKYADAVADFEAALKSKPADPAATVGLRQARTMLADSSPRQASYEKNMKEGQAALKAKKFADAVKEFEAALKDKPNDAAAMIALKQAQTALNDDKEFDKHLKAGQIAMRAKKFPDAVKEFEAALKINPSDKTALAELKKAKAAVK